MIITFFILFNKLIFYFSANYSLYFNMYELWK